MIERNKETLIKANEAVKNGDNEGFLAYCTQDVKWTFVGERVLEGKEAVRQYMAVNYIKPPQFDVKELIGENDYVTAIGNITLEDQNGKPTHYSYCDFWRFHKGKMAELMAFVIETGDLEEF
ncbi:nuclear transport factor 2 family protein [Antarcticibacterium sp. 1MA-6-2]|uniref:nuclear transport factor 2 family protein n=1 Tax=Antarcticibacterium sp. 1MA-6-2 TaxID=2908210 RepID=UPI001F1FDD34|nr:nuclear transport factor 2 family protein [Antarcticibacterium sp. 1MA-6-2]UJH91705.1 nuclear transport factor 2 family protein [Antarcticibacterium sp. 1MA-6-2]